MNIAHQFLKDGFSFNTSYDDIDRLEWRNSIFETISSGVPDRLAYVAACLRKSWVLK